MSQNPRASEGLKVQGMAVIDDCGLLGGSWDLVTRVIIKVTVLITTYNPT